MVIKLETIIDFLNSKNLEFNVHGDDIQVNKLSAIGPEVKETLCYYEGNKPDSIERIEKSIIICKPDLKINEKLKNAYIFTKHPQLLFYYISSLFENKRDYEIHPHSIVHESAIIGKNASIGPFSLIEDCLIGENVLIESGVKIHKGTKIGDNIHIQSNSVIGATGVMWAWDEKGNKIRCLQTGNVIIEDDVFIGSNVTIVKGAFENTPTIIGRKSLIGHGTLIGHSCIIGENNHLASNVSLAGSVQSGKNCFLGSATSARPHIKIPDNTTIGIGAVVVKNFKETGITLFGNPAEKLNLKTYSGKLSGVPARYS
ncbi:MAG TPA: hypothetical protein ENI07_06415 [Desulfobacterales bacterium]|nr:hypothetical protein [Desulfobacterales bacterium]